MKPKNNISKPLQDEQKVKEAIRVAMSETPEEEFNLDVLSDLATYENWKKNNPGKSFDDFLIEMGLKRKKLNEGSKPKGLSRETMLQMLQYEYPKIYFEKNIKGLSDDKLKRLLENLDTDGVPFDNGGLVSNYKKGARKP
jgi:hypothetical protein|tara:strand:+ start:658 stop:1077 length:420 start_codon:yes stop_codon:yes gene_type:complete